MLAPSDKTPSLRSRTWSTIALSVGECASHSRRRAWSKAVYVLPARITCFRVTGTRGILARGKARTLSPSAECSIHRAPKRSQCASRVERRGTQFLRVRRFRCRCPLSLCSVCVLSAAAVFPLDRLHSLSHFRSETTLTSYE